MYRRVRAYIRDRNVIKRDDHVIAGVSGGGDSMAMTHMLVCLKEELGFTLSVVHVHHGIRGEEADRDCAFVEEMCRKWKLPFQAYFYQVPALADKWKKGLEETGRLVRQEAFWRERERLERPDALVALAHNQDDVAETMIYNLARGSGIRGLSPMGRSGQGVFRPVLCLRRWEIDQYLKENKIPYVTDSTNLTEDYTRNRIRHKILPLMERELNPRIYTHLAETARFMAMAEEYLTGAGTALFKSCKRETHVLLGEAFFKEEEILQKYAVLSAFEALAGKRRDFSSVHVESVLGLYGKQTGSRCDLPCGLLGERIYEGVRLSLKNLSEKQGEAGEKADLREREWEIPLPGEVSCPLGSISAKIFSWEGGKIEEKKYTKWLDYDKIKCKLSLRTRRRGDFLVIAQTGGRKKLNRCLIDDKVPGESRDTLPLVAHGSEILWIVGGRINQGYKITQDTKRVLEITYQGGSCNE